MGGLTQGPRTGKETCNIISPLSRTRQLLTQGRPFLQPCSGKDLEALERVSNPWAMILSTDEGQHELLQQELEENGRERQ